MELIITPFEGLYQIKTKKLTDSRGDFKKLYNKNFLDQNNLISDFVDLNHSKSIERGVLRGFHYQVEPFEEIKLVNCIRGKVRDYAIDMRRDSSTYLQCFSIDLSVDDNFVIYVPSGFAHGYMALEKQSEVIYLSSNYHSPEHEKIVNPLDPCIGINFEISPILSKKDKNAPFIDR